MSVRAVKFAAAEREPEPVQSELNPARPESLATPHPPLMATAYVVRDRDLARIRGLKAAVVDRGRKHRAKPLSKLLLGQAKIPVISGDYRAAGQLVRSVRRLLANARQNGERNNYVIGANDAIFAELWERAARSAERSRQEAETRAAPASGWPSPTQSKEPSRLLLELLPRLEVPADLARRYLGESAESELVRQLILRAAAHDEPVLVVGDTGTGKEVVARCIHDYSGRRAGTFTPVNCSAIPRDLFESELFGHVRGAFTGAVANKTGLWNIADGGTLFLDEIGDLSQHHQAKILRALQEGAVRPVGAQEEVQTNARVIAASNRDLFAMVQAGTFREDLYYRLRPFLIRTPALRTHPRDIPVLADFSWRRITEDPEARLPADLLSELQGYGWPGNVRELKAVLTNIYALFGKDGLAVEHLRAVFQLQGQGWAPTQDSDAEREARLHRVRCMSHLRRADEVIRACKVTLRPLLHGRRWDASTLESVRAALGRRVDELEVLCLQPLLFHSERTYSTVHRLKGKLSYLLSLLQTDPKGAPGYWSGEVAGEFDAAVSSVFEEVRRLLKES